MLGEEMVIGITGGIGTGKSTILNILKEYGFIIAEADKIGHETMKKGQEAYLKIVEKFGNDILDSEDEIDRIKLGEIAFCQPDVLEQLNAIIHPAVKRRIRNIIESNTSKNIVVESAILFEAGVNEICDEVWYIYSDIDVRIKRLKESRGLSEEKIENIMGRQLREKEFEEKADATINNSSTIENTKSQIEKLLEFHKVLC